ncbi:MAG: hypothetical protein ACXVSL_20800 [Solirubrobacteraceae bacterium]
MPEFPSFLARFRRLLAPPGRPAEALGVPASGLDLEGELVPLLGALDAVGEQGDQVRRQARESARHRREEAANEAAAVIEQARRRADDARVEAASEQQSEADRHGAAARAAAQHEAELIRARGEERIASLLAEVLECVRRNGR